MKQTASPLFEHRHFVALAKFMAHEHRYNAGEEDQVAQLANWLQTTNPRFDRARFIAAASGNPGGRDRQAD